MSYSQAVGMSLLLALTACGGSFDSTPSSGYAPPAAGAIRKAEPAGADCGGSGKIKVRPCPVTLTKTHSSIDVKVTGPNVVDSAIKTNSKNRSGCGDVCEVAPYSTSNPLEYVVSAGTKCGKVALEFYGYDQSGNTVGIGKLQVTNKDCS